MTPMRVAAYARISSVLQRETSVDDQLDACRRYATQHGWTVLDAHVYRDVAISGATLEGRPGIQALLAAAATSPRPFDILLVDDSSRVARDLPAALHVLRLLTFFGIRTIYISQQINSDNEQAETLLTVHGLVDGLYLQETAKKIKRGLAGQLERGFHTGGKTYGYRTEPVLDPSGKRDHDQAAVIGHRLVVNDAQAEIIRRIYDWYAEGVPMPQMADRLTEEGVSAARGTRWTKNALWRILNNERYLGKQIWGQHAVARDPGSKRLVQRAKPRDEWHIRDRPDLRIVSDAQWQRVIQRREQLRQLGNFSPRTHAPSTRGRHGLYSAYVLVGLSRCGTCGGGITIVTSGRGSPRYGCPNSWRNGLIACDNRLTVRAKIVDPRVLAGLQAELTRPEMVQDIAKAVTAAITLTRQSGSSERQRLGARRVAVERKLAHLVEAVETGVAFSSIQDAMTARETELRQIDAQLAAIHDPPPDRRDDHPDLAQTAPRGSRGAPRRRPAADESGTPAPERPVHRLPRAR